MTYSLTTSAMSRSTLLGDIMYKLKGGRLVSTVGPRINSAGGYQFWVQCLKHKEYYQYFNSNLLDYEQVDAFVELAQDLINKCPHCAEADAHKKTRFPEGAEL
jgi:hypothetical protein